MIPFEEAYLIALSSVRKLDSETVDLSDAFSRILAQEVRADMDMPPYDKAMVDGYACRREDLRGDLRVVETVAAGYVPDHAIGVGECAKIMTGAMMPGGADCVFMVEHSETAGDGSVRFCRDETSDNVTPLGKHVRVGDMLLEPGHRIGSPEIAVLASAGCATVQVAKRPRVAVIATGDELVDPSETPGPSQIRNSNAYQLCAQLQEIDCVPAYMGIAKDTEESLDAILQRALDGNDVLLFSGGVSMGEFDLVPKILEKHGIKIQFDRVAIQPGKPTTFAYSDTAFCFGLPGNPVATYVIFELMVKSFLFAMMGHDYNPPTLRLPLAEPFRRKSGMRKAWVPVNTTDDGSVVRAPYDGSAHVNALCNADGLAPFPIGVTEMEPGSLIEVRMIRS